MSRRPARTSRINATSLLEPRVTRPRKANEGPHFELGAPAAIVPSTSGPFATASHVERMASPGRARCHRSRSRHLTLPR